MCKNFDSNMVMLNLLFLYVSCIITRISASLMYQFDEERTNFSNYAAWLDTHFHLFYGSWSMFNTYQFVNLSLKCKRINNWSMINLEFLLLFGLRSAFYIFLFVVLIVCCAPYLIYSWFEDRRS